MAVASVETACFSNTVTFCKHVAREASGKQALTQ